jgi:hypothetical protein
MLYKQQARFWRIHIDVPMWHQPECAADGLQGNTHRWSCCITSKVNYIVCIIARHYTLEDLQIHKALIHAESRIKHASKHLCNTTNPSRAVVMWVKSKPLTLRYWKSITFDSGAFGELHSNRSRVLVTKF